MNHLACPLNSLKDYWLGATGTFVSLLTVIIRAVRADLHTLVLDEAASSVELPRTSQRGLYLLPGGHRCEPQYSHLKGGTGRRGCRRIEPCPLTDATISVYSPGR